MAGHDKYRKYQVYFFLYLAVVCELLIVIVERDEAEEGMLRKQEELKRFNSMMIIMLVQNLPIADASAETKVFVGDTRYFDIRFKNVSEKTNIINPKIIVNIDDVPRDSVLLSTKQITSKQDTLPSTVNLLIVNDSAMNSPRSSAQNTRSYRFRYTPKVKGQFVFNAVAGTNAIEIIRTDITEYVQIGATQFKRTEVEDALNFWLIDSRKKGIPIPYMARNGKELLAEIMEKNKNVASEFRMEVVTKEEADQLSITPEKTVYTTSVGYPVRLPIYVEGRELQNVDVRMLKGEGKIEKTPTGIYYSALFGKPGTYTFTILGQDVVKRDPKGTSKPVDVNIIVKAPMLAFDPPADGDVVAGETFSMDLDVEGLAEKDKYSYVVNIDGTPVKTGTGSFLQIDVPSDALGKKFEIVAKYKDQSYVYAEDSLGATTRPSTFSYTVGSGKVRIMPENFRTNGTIDINIPLRVKLYRCGICSEKKNQRKVDEVPTLNLVLYDKSTKAKRKDIKVRMVSSKTMKASTEGGEYTSVEYKIIDKLDKALVQKCTLEIKVSLSGDVQPRTVKNITIIGL